MHRPWILTVRAEARRSAGREPSIQLYFESLCMAERNLSAGPVFLLHCSLNVSYSQICPIKHLQHEVVLRLVMVVETSFVFLKVRGNPIHRSATITARVDQLGRRTQKRILFLLRCRFHVGTAQLMRIPLTFRKASDRFERVPSSQILRGRSLHLNRSATSSASHRYCRAAGVPSRYWRPFGSDESVPKIPLTNL